MLASSGWSETTVHSAPASSIEPLLPEDFRLAGDERSGQSRGLVRPAFLAFIAGCEPGGALPVDSDAKAPSGVECVLQDDNVLRANCIFDPEIGSPVSVTITRPDGTVQTFTSTEPVVTLWDLIAETDYPWVAEAGGASWSGTLTTGELSTNVAVGFVDEIGEPSWDHIAFPLSCGRPAHVGVMDRDGNLVWYQKIIAQSDLGESQSAEGFRFTDDQTFLFLVGRTALREFDMTGRLLMEGVVGGRFDRPVHHDVHREGDWTYLLNAGTYDVDGTTYIMDGLYVLDRDGEIVADWALRDHVEPTGDGLPGMFWGAFFNDAEDFSHGNGIWTTGDDLILSFRGLSSLMAIGGDPLSPDFGQVRWVMDGDGDLRLGSDFTMTSSVTPTVGFQDQHAPNVGADGRLVLFDNRIIGGGPSRAIRLSYDPQQGEADITDAWELNGHCAVQGSAYALPNGNVLATCAVNQTVLEFAPGRPDPVWRATIACLQPGLFGGLLVRVQPVKFASAPSNPG